MKKILSSAVILGTLSTGAFADSYMAIGGASTSTDGVSQGGTNLDFGFGSIAKEGGLGHQFGMEFDFTNSDTKQESGNVGYIKYQPNYGITDNLRVFANIGYAFQSLGSTYSDGFGYGVGMNYNFTKSLSGYVAYKTLSLAPEFGDNYEYKSTTAGIAFNY